MSFHIGIFEDDKDVADILKEMMERKNFTVSLHVNLKSDEWKDCDLILGDFRNQIVFFNDLKKACHEHDIPLVAISGADCPYTPKLLKPFDIQELQATIMETMVNHNHTSHSKSQKKEQKKSLFSFFKKSG